MEEGNEIKILDVVFGFADNGELRLFGYVCAQSYAPDQLK